MGRTQEELEQIAKDALADIAEDGASPAAARAQAARTLAEMCGLIGKHQPAPRDEDADVAELDREALEREARRARR